MFEDIKFLERALVQHHLSLCLGLAVGLGQSKSFVSSFAAVIGVLLGLILTILIRERIESLNDSSEVPAIPITCFGSGFRPRIRVQYAAELWYGPAFFYAVSSLTVEIAAAIAENVQACQHDCCACCRRPYNLGLLIVLPIFSIIIGTSYYRACISLQMSRKDMFPE